jgi:CDGSH-type Zn-finger protein
LIIFYWQHFFEILEEHLAGTKVTVSNNGPLRVEGDFEIVDQTGKSFGLGGRTAVSLCRCGHSANSPFCDGSHKRQGFVSEVPARDLPPPVKPQ